MSALDEIKAREEKATPGPWVTFKGDHFAAGITSGSATLTWDDHGGEVFKPADAEFIAHARMDVPKLIAALEATLKFLDKLDRLDADMGTEPGEDNISASGVAVLMRRAITEALQ